MFLTHFNLKCAMSYHNTKDDLHQERFIGIFPNCLENSKDCHLVCFLGNDLFVTFHCDGKVVLASS